MPGGAELLIQITDHFQAIHLVSIPQWSGYDHWLAGYETPHPLFRDQQRVAAVHGPSPVQKVLVPALPNLTSCGENRARRRDRSAITLYARITCLYSGPCGPYW